MHVVHRLQHMPHQPYPRVAQVVQDFCDGAPFGDFRVRELVALPHSDYNVVHWVAHADRHVRKFRNRAEVVVAELYESRCSFVWHRALRLEGDEHYRHAHFARDCRKRRGSGVGHHVDKEQVEVCALHFVERLARAFGVVHQPERDGFNSVCLDFRLERIEFFEHDVAQAVELFPVGVEAHADDADFRGERLAPFDRILRGGERPAAQGERAYRKYYSFHNFKIRGL